MIKKPTESSPTLIHFKLRNLPSTLYKVDAIVTSLQARSQDFLREGEVSEN